METFIILLKYSLILCVSYMILFLIDRRIIKGNTKFLPVSIPFIMLMVIWIAVADNFTNNREMKFWQVMIFGLSISLIAEAGLQLYKLWLKKMTTVNIKQYLPVWYRNMGLMKCIAETLIYGLMISLPVAIHFCLNQKLLTGAALILIIILLATKPIIAGLLRKMGLWFK